MPTRTEGPTPAGGAYALAWAFDASGTEVEPSDPAAHNVLVVEYSEDGEELLRTYAGTIDESPEDRHRMPAAMHDSGQSTMPESTDLGKAAWDVRGPDQKPVDSVAGLLIALGWDHLSPSEQRSRVAMLAGNPSWDPAPDRLKQEAYAFLAGA